MGGDKKAQQASAQHASQNQAYQTDFENEQKKRSQEAYDRSNEAYGGANKLYQDFAAGGGQNLLDQSGYGVGGGGGGGGGGGSPLFGEVENKYRQFMNGGGLDPTKFNEFQGNLSEIGKTGGWSPEQVGNVNKSIAGFQNFADTGGVDAEGQNRMRGMGVYDEFSKTGGYSDQDVANARARGSSGVPALYGRVRDEASRLGRVQGGGGPGQAALMSRLARDQSRGITEASRETELGIKDAVNKGRQWGTEGVSRSEGSLQDLLSKNKLAGLGGVVDATSGMANSIADNRMQASNAGAGNETNWQALKTGNEMGGARGLEGMAESAAARSASSSAASNADARWKASFLADNMLAGAGGLRGLRTDVPGEVALYDQNRLNSRQIWNQGAAGAGAPPPGQPTDWAGLAQAGAVGAGTYFGSQGGQNSGYAGGQPRYGYPMDQYGNSGAG
jgi:hypothetical protein